MSSTLSSVSTGGTGDTSEFSRPDLRDDERADEAWLVLLPAELRLRRPSDTTDAVGNTGGFAGLGLFFIALARSPMVS